MRVVGKRSVTERERERERRGERDKGKELDGENGGEEVERTETIHHTTPPCHPHCVLPIRQL